VVPAGRARALDAPTRSGASRRSRAATQPRPKGARQVERRQRPRLSPRATSRTPSPSKRFSTLVRRRPSTSPERRGPTSSNSPTSSDGAEQSARGGIGAARGGVWPPGGGAGSGGVWAAAAAGAGRGAGPAAGFPAAMPGPRLNRPPSRAAVQAPTKLGGVERWARELAGAACRRLARTRFVRPSRWGGGGWGGVQSCRTKPGPRLGAGRPCGQGPAPPRASPSPRPNPAPLSAFPAQRPASSTTRPALRQPQLVRGSPTPAGSKPSALPASRPPGRVWSSPSRLPSARASKELARRSGHASSPAPSTKAASHPTRTRAPARAPALNLTGPIRAHRREPHRTQRNVSSPLDATAMSGLQRMAIELVAAGPPGGRTGLSFHNHYPGPKALTRARAKRSPDEHLPGPLRGGPAPSSPGPSWH